MWFHRNPPAAALVFASLAVGFTPVASACDLCAVYSADQAAGQESSGLYAGLAEQFTRYDRLSDEGHRIGNDGGQYLNSSITQVVLGYGLGDRFSVQLAVPVIVRNFRRPAQGGNDRGTEEGLGDINLSTQFTAWRHDAEAWTASARLLAGIKLPTGRSGRIAEELNEDDEEGGDGGAPVSGIHGHDLTLGSGSVDYVFGGTFNGRYGRWLARVNGQYALRTRGDFGYRFGDDVQWNVAAGRYLLLEDGRTLALNVNVSGEYKYFDDVGGGKPEDTQSRAVFVGPQLNGSLRGRYSADLRADFPVQDYGSSIQTLPSYRIRLSLLARF